jgi:hypothetical protein
MPTTQTQVHQFFWVWLLAAAYHAKERITSGDRMKSFLTDAWDAFAKKKKPSATDFGKKWKPKNP